MRGKKAKKREKEEDLLYNSELVTRLINQVMESGKKNVAEEIVYGALERLSEDRNEALNLLEQAVSNVVPDEEVRSRRVGGATYQVPIPLKRDRAVTLAIRWIVDAAKKRSGEPMVVSLTYELQDALRGEGTAVKKREQVHRTADANRAFAHFRW
ncbi:MAG: 30S ribosomal protein S7 [Patescibacteria group bacterium]|nr:30S ribosomal protein S7 [Patescibacteria group bacterium]